jgi:hypothetical protein
VRQRMVKVSVEVRSGTARFLVAAQSTRRALSLVGGIYPRGEVGVVFPIEPAGFFEKDTAALTRMVGPGQTHQEAA